MIVRERPNHFVLIEQHDHARLSGWLAVCWGNTEIPRLAEPVQGLTIAAGMHDLGWLEIDRNPGWNDEAGRPYSFRDEPLGRKLSAYRKGLDAVERLDPYAGLLCSLHYSSFFPENGDPQPLGISRPFVEAEQARQERLRETLRENGREQEVAREQLDLQLLKLWDELSLYVALNEPGVGKQKEHPWYREGFRPTWLSTVAVADESAKVRFQARWLDERRVALVPFPLRASLPYILRYRLVARADIQRIGFAKSCTASDLKHQLVEFVPDPEESPQTTDVDV